ncbi:SDR family oxidoreductase [Mesorhizobium sp. RP14(2022)]|uniref:SDR family oxidoreductase n=1 Tax=Mesorhizobium liriopis TaxID=2953882 RepID=A0ABT1C2F2_9HYPH|nr:SDR family oxidoreductase [Mesorhizobium liriopis]MCO6048823.1 SDR family oxidoreductase [Mesorhizobium liriopis]
MTNSKQRVAIVTGASKGIGAATALRLARDGFAVAVNYSRSAADADAVVRAIEAEGGRAIAAQADVADPQAVAALFSRTEGELGSVDVIVNNAGTMKLEPIAAVSDENFDRVVATNLKGVFNGMREAARRLNAGGRIISLSTSVVGTYGPNYGVYAATKAAVEALTHVLSKELGQKGITVNVVAPGPTATDLFTEGKSDELIARITGTIPLGRLGTPDEIANVIAFLAGPDGAWVNGQVIRTNGGMI